MKPAEHTHLSNSSQADNGWLGWKLLMQLSSDAWWLLWSKAIRLCSYGFLAVMLVIYLQTLHFSDHNIGLLFTLTLLGDALISIVLTSHADRWGRRWTLLLGSLLAILTSCIFATQSSFPVLLIAGIFGVISPSGSEMGPFMAIELSALAEVTTTADRTTLMAWYNLFGAIFSAFGAMICGIMISILQSKYAYNWHDSCVWIFYVYAGIQCIQMFCFSQLSPAIEVQDYEKHYTIKNQKTVQQGGFLGLHKSTNIVMELSVLFMLDSFAGSFVLQSIISAWFHDTYNTPSTLLGTIVFNCNLAAGISSLFAAEIARKIGLVLTMVVTHLPSNVLLILVPIMPTETTAIVMLSLRYCISQMDVPTRNAYVQGVVDADERSAANGITNVVRSIGAATGPYLCGLLLANPSYRNYPFYIAGGLKIVYDLLLLWKFADLKSSSDVHERGGQSTSSNTIVSTSSSVSYQQGGDSRLHQPHHLIDEEEQVELLPK